MFSTVNTTNVGAQFSQSPLFSPDASGSIPHALFGIYSERAASGAINTPGTYAPATPTALNGSISASVGVALSLIPIASPASAVIRKTDPATGLQVGADSTLGPILTERGETIGKGKWFLGFSHQDFHFTSINGQSLNGLSTSSTRAATPPPSPRATGRTHRSLPLSISGSMSGCRRTWRSSPMA